MMSWVDPNYERTLKKVASHDRSRLTRAHSGAVKSFESSPWPSEQLASLQESQEESGSPGPPGPPGPQDCLASTAEQDCHAPTCVHFFLRPLFRRTSLICIRHWGLPGFNQRRWTIYSLSGFSDDGVPSYVAGLSCNRILFSFTFFFCCRIRSSS